VRQVVEAFYAWAQYPEIHNKKAPDFSGASMFVTRIPFGNDKPKRKCVVVRVEV